MQKYIGRSTEPHKTVLVVSEAVLRGDAPFDWGNSGDGAAALALAILASATGDIREAEKAYQDYKREVVDRFPDDFEVTQYAVMEWVRDWRRR